MKFFTKLPLAIKREPQKIIIESLISFASMTFLFYMANVELLDKNIFLNSITQKTRDPKYISLFVFLSLVFFGCVLINFFEKN